jgi:hypothetical protein
MWRGLCNLFCAIMTTTINRFNGTPIETQQTMAIGKNANMVVDSVLFVSLYRSALDGTRKDNILI